MSSSTENSPTRKKVKQYKFNPSNPRAYELLTKHIAAKAKRSIKEKDNLGKIVATLVKGKYVSTNKWNNNYLNKRIKYIYEKQKCKMRVI